MPQNGRTHEERVSHLREMEQWLRGGVPVAQVVGLAVASWGHRRWVYYLDVAVIKRQWGEQRQRIELAAKAAARCDQLYCRAKQDADEASARGQKREAERAMSRAFRIEKHRCKVLGLYPPLKSRRSGKAGASTSPHNDTSPMHHSELCFPQLSESGKPGAE